MYVIFKQVLDNKVVYSYRNKSGSTNSHIKHIGHGVYINTVHPEILPMHEVADGFKTVEDVKTATDYYIQIDRMRGFDSYAASAQNPGLRHAQHKLSSPALVDQ